MKILTSLFLALALAIQGIAAISASAVWEVRAAGAATNGGFYVPGGPVDYSLQTTPQLALTDIVAIGTTTLTSVTGGFTSNMTNNGIYLAGGTGSLVATWRQVTFVDANTITVDANVAAGTGITGNIGGAIARLDTICGTAPAVVPLNTVFMMSGTYALNAGSLGATTLTIGCDGDISGRIYIVGYPAGGSRTYQDIPEASMPVVTTNTNSMHLFTLNGCLRTTFRNIKFTNTAATRFNGITPVTAVSSYIDILNCYFNGCSAGINTSSAGVGIGNLQVIRCMIENCVNTPGGALLVAQPGTSFVHIIKTTVRNNTGAGLEAFATTGAGVNLILEDCLLYGNVNNFRTTATTGNGNTLLVFNTTFANSSAENLIATALTTAFPEFQFYNCIIYGGTDGIEMANTGTAGGFRMFNCALGGQSGAPFVNVPTTFFNGQITLTVDPFVNAAGGDFSLNNATGGGNLLRSAGYAPTINGASTVEYIDVGAVQSKPLQTGSSN